MEEIRTYIDMEKTDGPYREYWKCLAHLCRHELTSAEEVRVRGLLCMHSPRAGTVGRCVDPHSSVSAACMEAPPVVISTKVLQPPPSFAVQEEALATVKGDAGRKSRDLHTSVLRDVQAMFDGKSSEELGKYVGPLHISLTQFQSRACDPAVQGSGRDFPHALLPLLPPPPLRGTGCAPEWRRRWSGPSGWPTSTVVARRRCKVRAGLVRMTSARLDALQGAVASHYPLS